MNLLTRRFGPLAVSVGLTVLILAYFLQIGTYGLSLPFNFEKGDGIWTFVTSKFLFDTGWILNNQYLAAPATAHWYANAAAQTSALHSVMMLVLRPFVANAITMQQLYFLVSGVLITLTTYIFGRVFGIHRAISGMMGLLFSFSTYRWLNDLYSFLPNYYMIPLALIPIFWIAIGKFTPAEEPHRSWRHTFSEVRRLSGMRSVWFSVAIIILTSASDGYYAFFTLLLIGFATVIALACAERGRLQVLIVPCLLAGVVVVTVMALEAPLLLYKLRHSQEWLIGGILDPAMIKHPFEAEVYAATLKFLLAPTEYHRIPFLAEFGRWIIATSSPARAFSRGGVTPLGILGSLLLCCFGAASVGMMMGRRGLGIVVLDHYQDSLFRSAILFIGFIFITSTWGGLGSLIALGYPEIRAYDRFPIFLIFCLLFCGGLVLSSVLEKMNYERRRILLAISGILTILCIFDQTPTIALRRNIDDITRFKAERRDIVSLESKLPKNALVYEYPYSQYMTDNKFYGWGSFSYLRLYLHSRFLHWSNGATKNSPVDIWHENLALLPGEQILREVRAVGFQALVVDRSVVHEGDYDKFRSDVVRTTGSQPVEHPDSQIAYWLLPPETTRVSYDDDFSSPSKLVVIDPAHVNMEEQSRFVNTSVLARLISGLKSGGPVTFTRIEHPDLFLSTSMVDRGLGNAIIPLHDVLKGDVQCPAVVSGASSPDATIKLIVKNRSAFDWLMNQGTNPIRIGLRTAFDKQNVQLRGDTFYRAPDKIYIYKNNEASLQIPVHDIVNMGEQSEVTAIFSLLQEGNAWFGEQVGNGECRVVLRR